MPNWNPNWANVRWNYHLADSAASALRSAADKLDSFSFERQRVAAEAQQEWRGIYRNEFDQTLRMMQNQSRSLADQMRDKAAEIGRASGRAWEEQKRRERDRERWWREKREEDRRREESSKHNS